MASLSIENITSMVNIDGINKDFESRVRLGILSILSVNDWVTFVDMKKYLDLSDGNLASHTLALETKGYIEVKKLFVGKKPETSYRITNLGRLSFTKHVEALAQLLNLTNL
jgi:predicted ArsR family transcriptional regulator